MDLSLQQILREFLGANSRTIFTGDLVSGRVTQAEYDALVEAEEQQNKGAATTAPCNGPKRVN